jgi:hypothetical protein
MKKNMPQVSIGTVGYNKLDETNKNMIHIAIMKKVPSVEISAKRTTTLPSSISFLQGKDLLAENKLPEFAFKPVEYTYNYYEQFFYYNQSLYTVYNDKRFEIIQ